MENIKLTNNIKKDIKEYTMENNPYRIVCEVGCVDDKYAGIAFQCIYKDNVIQPGSFIETQYGYEPVGELEEDKDLISLLDGFSSYISETYSKTWDEKPVIEDFMLGGLEDGV